MAKKYRHKIQFGIVDPNTFDGIVDDLHLTIERFPAFAIREPVKNLRYPLNEPRAPLEDELEGFVQDFLDGKLQPTVKSEPIPEPNGHPLVHVVGLTYQEIVMDKEKDVLLAFCIDPCGPCERLFPTLEKLALLYASNAKLKGQVTIGKIDIDENDIPDRGIQGFPTMKLYPAGAKDAPVFYPGTRTLRDLADFIRDHGTNKVELPELEEEQTVDDGEQAGGLKDSSTAQGETEPSAHDEL